MADVFISYVHRDHPRIVELSDALEAEGFTTWWDRQIGGGARFASQIEKELKAARAVVVAWSNDSLQSEWVIDEAEVAKQAGKLIPISLDGSQPPIGFRQYQVLNFQNWKGAKQASSFQELKKSIERFLYGAITSEETQSTRNEVRAPKNTLAVLPLENMTGDPAQQYFVDGMHSTLIASLSRVSALSVLSRTSTKVYANTTKSMREIGAELGAAKIIEGTVYRNGDQVSISVNLIDASTDIHDWSENYDREISDILQLQRDAAKDIADHVSVMLTPSEQNRFAAAPRVSPTAYDAYLKGMYHWYQLTPESLHQGIEQKSSVDIFSTLPYKYIFQILSYITLEDRHKQNPYLYLN